MNTVRFIPCLIFSPLVALAACAGESNTGPSSAPPPPPPPAQSTGSIRVITATTGDDLDPSAYLVSVADDIRLIMQNGSVTFESLSAGEHTVTLAHVAQNCSVGGAASQTVSVTGGGAAEARFDIYCEALPPADADVSGTWQGEYIGSNSKGTLTYVLEQQGDDVTASITYRHDDGAETNFSGEGWVSDSTLTLFFLGGFTGGPQHRVTSTSFVASDRLNGTDEEQLDQWSATFSLLAQ